MSKKQTVADTLKERGKTYGNFDDNARVAQHLKDTVRCSSGWKNLAPDQREALEIIASKISRLLIGDPDHIDSWHDIAGYATLIENRLEKENGGK